MYLSLLGPIHSMVIVSSLFTLGSSVTVHVRVRLLPAYRGGVGDEVTSTAGAGTIRVTIIVYFYI